MSIPHTKVATKEVRLRQVILYIYINMKHLETKTYCFINLTNFITLLITIKVSLPIIMIYEVLPLYMPSSFM